MKQIKIILMLSIMLILICTLGMVKTYALSNLEITVSGDVAGRTLSLYKLFNLEKDEENNYYYTWDGLASEEFFAKKGITTLFSAIEYIKGMEKDSTSLTNLAEEYYEFCTNSQNQVLLEGKIARISEKTAGDQAQKIVFGGLSEGYYLIYDETKDIENTKTKARSAAMISSLTKNEEVKIKTDAIDVEKEVDVTSANVGEDVKFTITTSVPRMIGYDKYVFNVIDILSKGMDFNNDIIVKIDGEEYSKILSENETEKDAYKVITTKMQDESTEVKIEFNDFIKLKNKAGSKIEITYSAKLNSKAAIEKDNNNQVKIIYSNNPKTDGTGESNTDVVHVYSFKLNLTKKNSKDQALNGAKFILKLEDGKYAKFNEETGIFTGTVTNENEATILTSSGTILNDEGEEIELGEIEIFGLKEGKYTLKEIEAPDGYSKPNFEFSFRIVPNLNNGILEGASIEYLPTTNVAKGYLSGNQTEKGNAEFNIEILNAQKGLLPSTGGIGTKIFTVIGISLMLIVVSSYIIARRKKLQNQQ